MGLISVRTCLRHKQPIDGLKQTEKFSSAFLELFIAAQLQQRGHSVEVRPELPSGKSADLLTKEDGRGVYFEIKQLDRSDADEGVEQLTLALILGMIFRARSFGRRIMGLPFFNTSLGPRTAWAGLTSRTWPVTSQSNSIRTAAKCCFTELKRVLRKHFKRPNEQLHPNYPGILFIQSTAALDPVFTRIMVEKLLEEKQPVHLSVVIFVSVLPPESMAYVFFPAFAVANPRARFPAKHLKAFESLRDIFRIAVGGATSPSRSLMNAAT